MFSLSCHGTQLGELVFYLALLLVHLVTVDNVRSLSFQCCLPMPLLIFVFYSFPSVVLTTSVVLESRERPFQTPGWAGRMISCCRNYS